MSIRPVQIAPLALPPPHSGRQAESPATPVAPAQPGVSTLPAVAVPAAAPAGTAPASNDQATAGDSRTNDTALPADADGLADALKQAQKAVDVQGRDLSFSIHEKTGEVVVQIIDRASKEVIKQIPAEEMLRLAERLQELEGTNKTGLLLKQEV